MGAICACLATVGLVGVAYAPTVTAGFVNREDTSYVFGTRGIWTLADQSVTGALMHGNSPARDCYRLVRELVKDAFNRVHYPAGTGGYYQPLVDLSFMVDAVLTGDSEARAFFFHLTNVALHLLNVALVFALARALSGSLFWGVLAALVFGLHPLQVESVAWVSQRMTLLAAAFSLIAIIVYLRYTRTGRLAWLVPLTLLYVAAVLSKPTFLALPLAMLLLDTWPLRRPLWRSIVEKIPLWLTMLLATAGVLGVRIHASPAQGYAGFIASAVPNVSSFVQRVAWPVALAPLYPMPATSSGLASADIAVVALAALALILSARTRPPLFVALAGAAIMVLPALVHLPYTPRLLGDEHLYAALIVPILAAVAWLSPATGSARPAWRRVIAVGTVAIVVGFGTLSRRQTAVWRDGESYFQRVVQTSPGWDQGYAGLIDWYLRHEDDRALDWARRACAADPDSPLVQFCFGTALLAQPGDAALSIEPLRKALASDRDWVACLQNLGAALAHTGRNEEAIGYLERARALDPGSADIRIDLGFAYLKVDRPAEARRELQIALNKRSDPMVHMGLAIAWAKNDIMEYARRHLVAALSRDSALAARAARMPALRALIHQTGFQSLLDAAPPSPPVDGEDWSLPTAGTGRL